jgi:electron transfer flavoprotein beta subunit
MLPEAIVCVKYAVTLRGALALTADERQLAPECLSIVPNEADMFTLEQALRLREQGLVGKITCITAGPAEAQGMLAICLAMGADRVLRIELPDAADLDEAATGALLGAAIAKLGVRLVLAAQRSDDGGSGIVPAAIARALGGAYLSNVAVVRLAGEAVEVERKLERGNRQVWSAALPAVVAIEPGTVVARYVSVAALILARRMKVETVTTAALGIDPGTLVPLSQLKKLATPRRRPKKTPAPVAAPPAAGGIRRPMGMGSVGAVGPTSAGGSKDKKILTGSPDELATAVFNLLVEREILSREAK